MSAARRGLRNERGSVVVMMAVTLFAMLALSALAIDLAALRDGKAEAQTRRGRDRARRRERVPGHALGGRGDLGQRQRAGL